ncbi:flagellar basal body rod protein FlgB [Gallaecimonas sp. GXIMD1310]|uniref:flagellar basal body rod protein FlgB n=1 Tax=Gallaecimonas sp. GXIMD1310 TaxID=3131926 RepID=UPI0032454C2C
MAISFNKAFGIHQYALEVRSQRAELLASNIANADTPGYKARDLDFKAALQAAQSQQRQPGLLATTSAGHMQAPADLAANLGLGSAIGYRIPNQPDTGDGNTVDVQTERSLYLQNALEYQTSVQFLSGKIKGLMTAIKGE